MDLYLLVIKGICLWSFFKRGVEFESRLLFFPKERRYKGDT